MLFIYRYIILLMLPVLICSGCSKEWFNKKPDQNLTIPATLKDFELLMDHPDMTEWGVVQGELGSDDFYTTEEGFIDGGTTDIDRNAYTWSHNAPNEDAADWVKSYEKVFYCNTVLDGLNKINPSNENEQKKWNEIKGNALFHRGLVFFELSQQFAPQFNAETAENDLSIPLRLSPDIVEASVHSTVAETYNRIVSDLTEAVSLLPELPLYKTRGCISSAYGLLSRVYLSMGDYEKAKLAADKFIELGNDLIDYNTIDSTFQYPFPTLGGEVVFHKGMGYGWPIIYLGLVNNELYNSYNENDLRKTLFFLVNPDNTIAYRGSYYGSLAFFCGIATDEIYLNRAECRARLGNVDDAMEDLNLLMMKRWKNTAVFEPFTASTKEDALNIILTERRKELIGRGLRWSDLRRLSTDLQLTLTRTIGGETYTLEPGSYKYTFPIPDDIIARTGMEQNTGW